MTRIVGSYHLLERIGAGGMGEVWRARHARLGQLVAVKLIAGGASGERGAVERFLREARAAAGLRSPHAIRVHDLGVTEDGTFYQAMELLAGLDLQALVEREGPLPPGRVVALLRQACDALAEAHAQGIVHRDVKPSNLFLARGGTQVDRLVVLDFGLARDPGDDALLTHTGAVLGSPAYVAPELLRGHAATPAADVYGLGGVAWWLLTGRLVFGGRSAIELVVAHLEREPGPLPGVPDGLAAWVRACLSKDPLARPDARTLSSELAALALPWTEAEAEAWWDARGPAGGAGGETTGGGGAGAPRGGAGAAAGRAGTAGSLQAERESAYAVLRRRFEASRLDLGEMDRRMARVGAASDAAGVRAALDGLGPFEPPVPAPRGPTGSGAAATGPAAPPAPVGVATPIFAVFGQATRRGPWAPAPHTRVAAVFGGVLLDLRDARFGPGLTELRCFAAFGGIRVIAPPELRVEVAGIGIAGGFASRAVRPGDGPMVRVTGLAVCGGVEVVVRPRKATSALADTVRDAARDVGEVLTGLSEALEDARERKRKRKRKHREADG